MAGKVQIIWAGETDRCHPKGDETDVMSDVLLYSHSTSHWTTESTILEYVAVLYATYILPKITEKGVDPETQKWLLLWDCYSVHRSGPVLEVLKSKYPNSILLFVPAPAQLSFSH